MGKIKLHRIIIRAVCFWQCRKDLFSTVFLIKNINKYTKRIWELQRPRNVLIRKKGCRGHYAQRDNNNDKNGRPAGQSSRRSHYVNESHQNNIAVTAVWHIICIRFMSVFRLRGQRVEGCFYNRGPADIRTTKSRF